MTFAILSYIDDFADFDNLKFKVSVKQWYLILLVVDESQKVLKNELFFQYF
jgi:hypothetical protein